MACEFNRFHYREANKFDKCCIYGDVRIGVVIFTVRDHTYYCVDLYDMQTRENIHMDCFVFEQCVNRLVSLSATEITHPYYLNDTELRIKQIPFTNTYKVTYDHQKMIFDVHAIEGIKEIWKWINFNWD